MTTRTARWILWITFALTIPLPFFLAETGRVPAAAILMLAAVSVAVMVVEGTQGAVTIAAELLLAQAVIYLAALWLAAWLISRMLRRRSRSTIAAATVAVVAVLVIVASVFEIYHTPFRTRSLHANLRSVFE